MTTATDEHTDLDVNLDAQVPCKMRRKEPCPNPAAWLAVITHEDDTRCAPMPTCDECKAGVIRVSGRPGRVTRCGPHRELCTLEWRRL